MDDSSSMSIQNADETLDSNSRDISSMTTCISPEEEESSSAEDQRTNDACDDSVSSFIRTNERPNERHDPCSANVSQPSQSERETVNKIHKCDDSMQKSPSSTIQMATTLQKKHNENGFDMVDWFKKCLSSSTVLKQCRKTYSKREQLNSDVCYESYLHSSDLNLHNRIRSAEKQHHTDMYITPDMPPINTPEKDQFDETLHNRDIRNINKFIIHTNPQTGMKTYECDVCGKRYSKLHHVNRHRRIHTGEKPYGCNVCGKKFTANSNLSRHIRVHSGDEHHKPHKCDVCDKKFSQLSYLNEHKRIHTGERPYECSVCGKMFSYNSNLSRHRRVHTGEKPYECETCGKTFLESATLNNHRRVHTREKPYECGVCGKRFSVNSSLSKHRKVHTGKKIYECDVCGKVFSRLFNLNAHEKNHAGKNTIKK